MKKRIKKLVVFLVILFFTRGLLQAQVKKEEGEKTLVEVIPILETRYNVQFNYAEDVVKGFIIKEPNKKLLFDECITNLKKATGLLFSKLDSNIILIKPNTSKKICGYIKNIETQEPVSSVVIKTLNNVVISNENGFFQLEIENVLKPIIIECLGYATLVKDPTFFQFNTCHDILLIPSFQKLSEVLISNYIVNGINKINNGSFEINFNDFDILPGLIEADVLQSIQSFPGIQSINETVSNISIRGGTHDQNLLLWDDIKMYQSGHFFGLISMYNPEITQSVSLRKNGSNVAFSDGVSGTIDMQTNKFVNSQFKGVVGVNLTNLNGFADIPLNNKSSIQIAARKSISDFIETPTHKAFFNRISQNTEVANNQMAITNSNKSFDFYDTSFRWIYKITDADKLRVNFINVYNKLIFDENATINNESESLKSSLSQLSIAGAINYERSWNNRLQTVLEIYETDYKLKSLNANIIDSQRFLQENIISETSTKLKADYKINNKYQLLSGYHFVETKVTNLDDVDNPLFRDLKSRVLRVHGIFSELGFRSSNKKTNLNLGIRYNYISKFKKHIWEPRLSFSQKILPNFTLEILGEFKHQNTSQVINFQSDFLGVEKRRWQLSNNSDIPVIKSKQLSSGITYNKNGWLLNVDGYYKKVKGVTTQSQGFQNQFEFIKSIGDYQVKGFDVLLKKRVANFNTWLSYSYMNNDYYFKKLSAKVMPSNYDVTHLLTIGSAVKFNKLKVSTGFNWHTGKPTTKPLSNEIVNNEINYKSANSDHLKEYLRLDVSAVYTFKLGKQTKASFGASVWNVLDKKNEINAFYRLAEDVINNTTQHSLGITPNAVFKLTF